MHNIEAINNYLEESNISYVHDFRIRNSDEAILLYINRELIADKVSKGYTSIRQIKNLQEALERYFNTSVVIIYTRSDSHIELETGFFRLLNLRLNGQLVAFYISFDDEEVVNAWVEISELNQDKKDAFLRYYKELIEGAGFEVGIIHWNNSENELPTLPAILRAIKTYQPIDIDSLLAKLSKNHGSLSERWLRGKLDLLRKRGVIHWQKPGSYVLTADALSFVPSGTSRNSSDIARALALGRRKW